MSRGTRIARNAGYLTLAKAGAMGLNFVVWAYLARVLEAGPYGQIGVGLALVGYFALLISLGFDAVAMREVARNGNRLSSMVGEVIGLRVALLLVAGLVYGGVVIALPRPLGYKVLLAVIGVQLVVKAVQLDWVYIATERAGVVAAREMVAAVVMIAGTFALVRGPDDVAVAAALVVGAPLLSVAGMWVAYRRSYGPIRPRIDVRAWKALMAAGLPLAASALMIELYTSLDRLMLEGLRTTEEAGLYFGAYKVLSLAIVPAAVLTPAFFASLAEPVGDREAMRASGRSFARALLTFGVPVAIAGPVLAGGAIVLVNGATFAVAGPALAILLVNAGVIHANTALGTPLMAWDLQRPYMWTVVAGGVANVILNVVLIPRFGIEGAAAATLASEMVVGAGLLVVYRRATGDVPLGPLVRIVPAAVLGAAAPSALGVWLDWPVLVSALAGGVGYGVAAWVFGVVDRDWIREGLRRRFAGAPEGDQ